MRNEWRSPEELRRLQEDKLRRLAHHAYRHVSMYRELWQSAGVHPSEICTIDDLARLPVIDKRDFHRYGPSKVIDRRIRHRGGLLSISTSGSSGVTLQFWAATNYDQLRKAQFLRPYLTNGQRLWDRVLWFRAKPNHHRQWFHKLGLLPEYQIDASVCLREQREVLMRFRPHILRGYGSAIALLARHLMEESLAPPPIKRIFTDSEMLPLQLRRIIEEGFQAPVIDVYGTFETENVAYECQKHKGYHITSDCVIMEFLRGGEPVEPGAEGEIVCTVLDNLTTPFIRYNLHDLGVFQTERCPCGRGFPLMSGIVGRSHDYIHTPDGRKITTTLIAGRMHNFGHYLHQFQVVQQGDDLFCIKVIPTRHFNHDIERQIISEMQALLSGATVCVETVRSIPREKSGKHFEVKLLQKYRRHS